MVSPELLPYLRPYARTARVKTCVDGICEWQHPSWQFVVSISTTVSFHPIAMIIPPHLASRSAALVEKSTLLFGGQRSCFNVGPENEGVRVYLRMRPFFSSVIVIR